MLLKLKHRHAAAAFEGWALAAEARRRNRGKVHRSLARMRLRAAAMAYDRWCEYMERRRVARKPVRPGVIALRQ